MDITGAGTVKVIDLATPSLGQPEVDAFALGFVCPDQLTGVRGSDRSLLSMHVAPTEPQLPDSGDTLGAQLLAACKEGNEQIVQSILKAGADIEFRDEEGRSPAMIACLRGHQAVLHALLSRGFDQLGTDAQGRAMDYYLAHFGHGSDEQLAKQAAYQSLMTIQRIRETGRN